MVGVDTNSRPLSASDVLTILENTDALEKMKDNGYNAVEFQQLAPSTSKSGILSLAYTNV